MFSVFNFLHIGKVERGKVLSTHYKRQNMLTYPYCIYDIYIHWHMIFSIYSNLWLSVNFYGLSLYIYIQYKTTVSSEAFILWSMKTSNIQSKEPTTYIVIILNFKQVHFGFFYLTLIDLLLKPHPHTFYEANICIFSLLLCCWIWYKPLQNAWKK